jgi:hypothetical protein
MDTDDALRRTVGNSLIGLEIARAPRDMDEDQRNVFIAAFLLIGVLLVWAGIVCAAGRCFRRSHPEGTPMGTEAHGGRETNMPTGCSSDEAPGTDFF